jgi:tRNA modification GTPase
MVSDIAGTTRDTIEATTIIDGIRFRFVDTAGIHDTANELEKMGIERTHRAIEKAYIILHLTSAENPEFKDIERNADQHYIQVVNKIDKNIDVDRSSADTTLYISAKQNLGIDELRCRLRSTVDTSSLNANSVVVSNMRHYAALRAAHEALLSAHAAIESNMPSDLISEDIRQVLHHLGEITGEITSDDILHSIFSKFCIGK